MKTPLVSICIPAFNAEASITSCLNGVLAQAEPDWEIIVVDNCSTDRTAAISRELLSGRPNAEIIVNSTNLGRIGNWNRCIELSRGKFIKFAFTNDVLLPGAVKALLKPLIDDEKVLLSGSRQMCVKSIPEHLPKVATSPGTVVMPPSQSLLFLAKKGFADLGSLNGMLYRRSPIIENNLQFREDIPYFADFVQALEMASCGNIALIEAETYLFNEGASGRYHFAGLKNLPKYLSEHRKCTDRHTELLRYHGLSDHARSST